MPALARYFIARGAAFFAVARDLAHSTDAHYPIGSHLHSAAAKLFLIAVALTENEVRHWLTCQELWETLDRATQVKITRDTEAELEQVGGGLEIPVLLCEIESTLRSPYPRLEELSELRETAAPDEADVLRSLAWLTPGHVSPVVSGAFVGALWRHAESAA